MAALKMRFSAGIFNAINVQLVHLVLKCCSLQSQALGRSTLAGDSPGGSFQSVDDDLALSLFETGGCSSGSHR